MLIFVTLLALYRSWKSAIFFQLWQICCFHSYFFLILLFQKKLLWNSSPSLWQGNYSVLTRSAIGQKYSVLLYFPHIVKKYVNAEYIVHHLTLNMLWTVYYSALDSHQDIRINSPLILQYVFNAGLFLELLKQEYINKTEEKRILYPIPSGTS